MGDTVKNSPLNFPLPSEVISALVKIELSAHISSFHAFTSFYRGCDHLPIFPFFPSSLVFNIDKTNLLSSIIVGRPQQKALEPSAVSLSIK